MPDFSELPSDIKKVIFFTRLKRGLCEIADDINNMIEFNREIASEIDDITEEVDLCKNYFMFLVLFAKIVGSNEFRKLITDIDTYTDENCQHNWKLEVIDSEVDRTATHNVCSYCDSIQE